MSGSSSSGSAFCRESPAPPTSPLSWEGMPRRSSGALSGMLPDLFIFPSIVSLGSCRFCIINVFQDTKARVDSWMDGWSNPAGKPIVVFTGLEVLAGNGHINGLSMIKHKSRVCREYRLILYLCFESSIILSTYARNGLSELGSQEVFCCQYKWGDATAGAKRYFLWGTHSFVAYGDFNWTILIEFAPLNNIFFHLER